MGWFDEAGDRSRLPRADLVMNGNINNPTAVFVAEACRNVRRAVGQARVPAPIAGQRKKKREIEEWVYLRRSRQALSNEPWVAAIGVDTPKNGASKVDGPS